jgi:microcystin-dependent protein
MTIPNTLVAGEFITASDHNENYSDVAAELTNSVAVDGQSTMTGPLKAASGTVAAPGITFGSDTDSGLYRIGANNIGVAVNGAKVVDVGTTGAAVTGTLSATGAISQNGFALLPVGLGPLPWCGVSAPSGWVLCYGQSLSRTAYASLWAFAEAQIALGNPLFTNGDGSTTFTILDMRGYVAAGKDNMGGTSANRLTDADDGLNGDTLGDTGGGETQTLAQTNLPNVNFTVASGQTVSGTVTITSRGAGTSGSGLTSLGLSGSNQETITGTFAGTVTNTGTAASGGSGTAFGIIQPTIILNQIIFAGV